LVQLAVLLAVLLDILHVTIVECGEVRPGFSVGAKELWSASVHGVAPTRQESLFECHLLI
jgi:hypothetical protein